MKVSWSVNERLWKSERAVWRNHYQPPAANILSAASLARQGFLTEVKFMHRGSYQDEILDISSIPLLDLVKLSKCVSDGVNIEFDSICDDLSPVLININCDWLHFVYSRTLSLTTAETQALVTAVISGVRAVRMDAVGRDLGVLAQCDGKGTCDCIKLGRCRFLEFSNGPGQHACEH